MRKTLILYVSAGAGHKSAALAIEETVHQLHPDEEVLCKDILEFSNWSFKKIYLDGYLNLVKKSEHLWGYLYDLSDKELSKNKQKVRSLFNSINLYKFCKFLQDFSPGNVICTHFLPLERTLTLKEKHHIPAKVSCCITDYCVHSLWIMKKTDLYFTGNKEAKRELIYSGIAPEKIFAKGIPISLKFSQKNNVTALRASLKISARIPTVLCMSGGFGVGPIEKILESFHLEKLNVQVLVICGKNEEMKKNIRKKKRKWKFPLKVLGFMTNMHELYDIADIVISKPGGLTTSEILAKQKPFIIVNPIPGQEERNSDFLLEKGMAVKAHTPRDVAFKVKELLESKTRFEQMKKMARKYGKPKAVIDIVKTIYSEKPALLS